MSNKRGKKKRTTETVNYNKCKRQNMQKRTIDNNCHFTETWRVAPGCFASQTLAYMAILKIPLN